jgi:ADP-ribose pyrophosphatase YjhB (NUDIX family)
MTINEAINILRQETLYPEKGIDEQIFYYVSSIIPMVNVDLLIQNESGETLLSWRDDIYCGTGWHVPGGVVRYKEKLEKRVNKVAEIEIGTKIIFNNIPIKMSQVISPKSTIRGHFISFLYQCFLPSTVPIDNKNLTPTDAGYLKWFKTCPDNLISIQSIYKEFIH